VNDSPINGTMQDVAAFRQKTVRTVQRWLRDGSLGSSKIGNGVLILEADMVERLFKKYRPGEALSEEARRLRLRDDWRAFMKAREQMQGPMSGPRGTAALPGLNDFEARLARIEARLGIHLEAAA
jgi:hypothetical protein